MITQDQVRELIGATVYGIGGDKIGKAAQVYFDDDSGQPKWITVATGLFGTRESFVPLAEANLESDRITVPYSKDKVKDGPNIDADQHLSPQEEAELYRYYAVAYGPEADVHSQRRTTTADRDRDAGDNLADRARSYTSERTSDDAMTRSEERLKVGTQSEQAGRARLRKYVVTENVQQTVPVSREEVRVEREPITEDNVDEAMRGPDLSEAEHEVTLRAERPVVEKETVPVERIRLEKETVTDQETVSDEVRREQIEAEGADIDDTRR